MAHFWQKLNLPADVLQSDFTAADYYRDPLGKPKPIMVQDMDNSHGASDLEHCFMLGFDFFYNDRDASIGNSFAGHSTAASRHMRRSMVHSPIAPMAHRSPSQSRTLRRRAQRSSQMRSSHAATSSFPSAMVQQ